MTCGSECSELEGFPLSFICLAAPRLSPAPGIFPCGAWTLQLQRAGLVGACGILVPQPGIEPTHPCIARRILNHRTTGEVPVFVFFVV